MYGIIYKAVCPMGKVYVGQTTGSLASRKGWHKFQALENSTRIPIRLALREYGFSAFSWEQIDTADTQSELDLKEKQWIAHFDSMNPEKGYNRTDGGIKTIYSPETRKKMSETKKGNKNWLGKQHSSESRKKISEALKGTRLANKNPMYGKPHSKETRKKMSEAARGNKNFQGKHHSIETRKKMSEAQKGEKHPLFGKHHSEETRRKMSEAHKSRRLAHMLKIAAGEQQRQIGGTA